MDFRSKLVFRFIILCICIAVILTSCVSSSTIPENEAEFALTESEREYLSSISGRPVTFAYSYGAVSGDGPSGLNTGMLAPFFDAMQSVLGLEVETVRLDWSNAFDRTESGAVDFYGVIALTDSRREQYITIDPVYRADTQIVSRVASPVCSPMSLTNEKIGLLQGSIMSRLMETYIAPAGEVIYYPSLEAMIEGLEGGEIRCFATADNAELEILEHEDIQYEFSIDNFYVNQGFISANEEMRPLAAIINRYIAHDAGLSDEISEAKRDHVLARERVRLADDITALNSKYDVIVESHSGGAYPVCYEEDGVYKGIQVEIDEIVTSLTGLEIEFIPSKSYSNEGGISGVLNALRRGECLVVGGGQFNLDIAQDPGLEYSRHIWVDTIRTYSAGDVKAGLKDLRVGTTALGASYANWDILTGSKPTLYGSRPALLDALRGREVDVAFLSEMSFNYTNIVERDYSLREYGGISAEARINMIFSSDTPELRRVYDSAIHLYRALYPRKQAEWLMKSERYKSDYIRIRDQQHTLVVSVIIAFLCMLMVTAYLLRRYTVYDKQISQLIRNQQSFDLAWGNLKTRVFTSKGDHPFFRKWGLKFSGPKCSMDELAMAFGWDLSVDYKRDLENMARDNISFIASDKKMISPIDGAPRYYRRHLHRLNDHEFMSYLQDVTGEVMRHNALEHIATTDFLSNLLTRRAMNDKIIEKCAMLREHGGQAALIMIDIDDFKKVNDTYGHDVGDKVLVSVSEIIQSTEGCRNSTARWGGEEFLILLDCDSLGEAGERAMSIIRSVERTEVAFGDKSISVTVSVGLTSLDPELDHIRSVINADNAMYAAKRGGKNCLRVN